MEVVGKVTGGFDQLGGPLTMWERGGGGFALLEGGEVGWKEGGDRIVLYISNLLKKKSNTLAWEIYLAPVHVQILMRFERASQFDPATDKICK